MKKPGRQAINNRRHLLDGVSWPHDGTDADIWAQWRVLLGWLYGCMGVDHISTYLGISSQCILFDLIALDIPRRPKGWPRRAGCGGREIHFRGQRFESLAHLGRFYGRSATAVWRHHRDGTLDKFLVAP